MQYRSLGESGLKVSAVGLGTNQFGGKVDAAQADAIIRTAVELGINFIDTADVYRDGRSEEFIGAAISDMRDKVLVATKVGRMAGAAAKTILEGAEASLRRLAIETIDLYQLHIWDDNTPIEETMEAFHQLVKVGKVRYIGASNFSAWQLTHANAVAELKKWPQFVSIQPHFHMLHREVEAELLPACKYFDIGVLPYFPLAGGFLTGKYKRGQAAPKGSRGEESPYVQKYMTDGNYDIVEKLAAFATERGHDLNELAHAWLLAQPQVSSVISGATRPEQVQANAKTAAWQLTTEDVEVISGILNPKPNDA